ncbi:MAG: hypothetical protein GY950_30900 [bacterium]|nr:hypothetical protein [bacterium]
MTDSTTTDTADAKSSSSKSKFKNQNFQTKVGRADLLLAVLREETPENLARYGITDAAVTGFETIIGTVKTTDKSQEAAKATLKTWTAKLDGEQGDMEKQYSTFKRKIKAETPMEEWKRFGFADKQ